MVTVILVCLGNDAAALNESVATWILETPSVHGTGGSKVVEFGLVDYGADEHADGMCFVFSAIRGELPVRA